MTECTPDLCDPEYLNGINAGVKHRSTDGKTCDLCAARVVQVGNEYRRKPHPQDFNPRTCDQEYLVSFGRTITTGPILHVQGDGNICYRCGAHVEMIGQDCYTKRYIHDEPSDSAHKS